MTGDDAQEQADAIKARRAAEGTLHGFGPDLLRKHAAPKVEPKTETRREHHYLFYGQILSGYGPSMDPHICGDPAEPCITRTEEREVGPWRLIEWEHKGGKTGHVLLDRDDLL